MSRAPGSSGVRIACIALAGTLGAMGMLGHRRGGTLELFAAGGNLLVSRSTLVPAAVIGVAVHTLWMVVWGVALVAVARHHRGLLASLDATGVAILAFAASIILPAVMLGPVGTLTIGERALVHVVLAVSLMVGMRLAPRVTRASYGESVR